MNLIDLLVILALLVGALAGARAGFLGPVLGLIAAATGFGLAILLASVLRPTLLEIEQPLRALLTLGALGMLVLGGEAAGAAAGSSLSYSLRRTAARPLDVIGGAVVGVAHVVLLVWLANALLSAGLAPQIAAVARDSVTVRVITERLPAPNAVAGTLVALVGTTDLPQLFAGLEPPPAPPVDLPADEQTRALAESAVASTTLVTGTGCGLFQQVGSGFFVGPSHVLTNAHVVAGAEATTVSTGGVPYDASVVLFDPNADLALLHVPEANGAALQLASQPVERGQAAVALGHPGGGPLTSSPAAITAGYDVLGPNIYGEGSVPRSVVEMRAQIERGNSGGPLVIAPGVVGGVVFGASRVAPDVGYAIAATQAAAVIGPAIGATQPVDTGPCG